MGTTQQKRRMQVFALALALALAILLVTEGAHLVELKKRDVPVEEQHQILELLQLGEDSKVPNIRLNSNFFGSLLIGKEQQSFEVVFDTGSDALWVYSDSCRSCIDAKKHVFKRDASPTYHFKDTPFSIKYGTGESHGTTGTDIMRLGDLEVNDQVFGQCDEPDDVMRGFPFDGIVGLSRPMFMDPNGLIPIMDTVKQEHVLANKKLANTFSFYLGRDEGDKSYLIFGGSHHMLHEGAVHWVPAMSKNIFWELPLDDILIHEKKGNVSIMATKKEIALERHFHDTAIHDGFAQIMADPYQHAPKAELITDDDTSSHHNKRDSHKANHKRHKNHPEPSVTDDMPGQSEDGYDFVTQAEPVLLELESSVSMMEEEMITRSKPHNKANSKAHKIHETHHESLIHASHKTKASNKLAFSHPRFAHELEVTGKVDTPLTSDDNKDNKEENKVDSKAENKDDSKDNSKDEPHAPSGDSSNAFDVHAHLSARAHPDKNSHPAETDAHAETHDIKHTVTTAAPAEKKAEHTSTKQAAKVSHEHSKAPQHAKATVAINKHSASAATTTNKNVSNKKQANKPGSSKTVPTASAGVLSNKAPLGNGELLSDLQTTPGVSINPCHQDSTHPCIASMDSGHSLISGPPELVRKLKELTTPAGACTEEATANMPDVSFVIGGKLFTLTPMDYLIELEGHCTPAFRERPFRNGHDWVLGEHFMRTFYSVFDYDDMRVGLARLDNIKQHIDTILSRK
eukprot:c10103_g1_i1.p1 GENE.c10103_g1_i1~~c10103_g1_i1.p1  ORF type:complete len:741 (+),score=228.85 c10103_g1_i1:1-2223(+)